MLNGQEEKIDRYNFRARLVVILVEVFLFEVFSVIVFM